MLDITPDNIIEESELGYITMTRYNNVGDMLHENKSERMTWFKREGLVRKHVVCL